MGMIYEYDFEDRMYLGGMETLDEMKEYPTKILHQTMMKNN